MGSVCAKDKYSEGPLVSPLPVSLPETLFSDFQHLRSFTPQ